MIKTILGYLFILSFISFYIYYGIRLIDNFKTKTEVVIYLISYVLLGFTILNLVLVSVYWEVLSVKRGPPGPRGLMGDEGDSGIEGSCSLDHNIMFALIQIKSAIADTIVNSDDTKTTKVEDIYNENENTLVNNTLDTIINRIVQSKEFDTILLRPDNNEASKYGKSLKDIVGYLKSIITSWCSDIYKLNGGPDFFKTIDGSFTDTPEIEEYFHNEIEKYDIWYWGGTRVFKPLEIMVMRQSEFRDNDGNKQQNSAFPMDDLPRIEIMEIEYSDNDTSNLEWLWDTTDMTEPSTDYSAWKRNEANIYSDYVKPAIYIPKVKIVDNKKFYPVGCVMLEGDPDNKTNAKKKTILVTGDVVIPDNFTLMWKDRKQIHSLRGTPGASDGYNAGLFYRLETDNNKYKTIGDIFWSKGGGAYQVREWVSNVEKNINMLKNKFNTDNPESYSGIVALPIEILKEVTKNNNPEWSYKKSGYRFAHPYYQVDLFTSSQSYNILRAQNATFKYEPLTVSNGGKIGNQSTRGGKLYKIDMNKIKHRNNPLKETEPENNDLGFGYYGYPYLITDKYSIFKFLDLVPEGLIINYNNNRKLYIRHYGGAEMNRYNIFKYDSDTGRYDKALRVNGPTNIQFSRMKPNDPRFAFSYEIDTDDNKFIRFKSISNPDDGYLKYISQITNTDYDTEKDERPGGVSIDHTRSTFMLESGKGEISNKNKKLFMFLQAHGRGLTNQQLPRLDLQNMKHPGTKKNYTPITTSAE